MAEERERAREAKKAEELRKIEEIKAAEARREDGVRAESERAKVEADEAAKVRFAWRIGVLRSRRSLT